MTRKRSIILIETKKDRNNMKSFNKNNCTSTLKQADQWVGVLIIWNSLKRVVNDAILMGLSK